MPPLLFVYLFLDGHQEALTGPVVWPILATVLSCLRVHHLQNYLDVFSTAWPSGVDGRTSGLWLAHGPVP